MSHSSVCGTIRLGILIAFSAGSLTFAQVTTSQYNNARTGANLNETKLTPQNVNAKQFGKRFSLKVQGDVYAQPLFLAGVEVPGKGKHDLLFIVTEHDSAYAFDAYGDPSTPLWQVSFLKNGATPVPADNVECPFIAPEVGITSTPVIDAKTGTLYILERTKERSAVFTSGYRQHLHALAVTTGVEKFGGPVEIQASAPGRGSGSAHGRVDFDPLRENPRAALLLANNTVYLSWGSSCDVGPYHGWVLGYDAQTLKQTAVFNTSPDADDSGIWSSDTGLASDDDGNIFVPTGNGAFDRAWGGHDFGDSLLKLRRDGNGLGLSDYFAPFNVDDLDRSDSDLGSGGPMLLPDQPGPHKHLAVIAGKGAMIYLIDRDRMGRYQPQNNSHAVQTIPVKNGIFGSMAYWKQNVYALAEDDALQDFEMKNGKLLLKTTSGVPFGDHSATPAISANGTKNGIVWVLSSKGWNSPDRLAVLHAYDASNIAHELYTSKQDARRDSAGKALRFNMPTVANGHVYVGAKGEVDVYGLLSPTP